MTLCVWCDMIVVVMVCDGGDDSDGGHCYPRQETRHTVTLFLAIITPHLLQPWS